MELKLEPQSSLSPLQARSILNRWGEDGTALVLTTAFPSLEIGGTVLVSRIESEAIELRTKDGTVWFVFRLGDTTLRLYGSSDRLVLDVAGDLPARLTLTPLDISTHSMR